jgi:hypothetical protein
MAIDYTNPSVNDPLIRNAITYLLNSQATDNSWPFQNGPFTTKLGPASFVMAYLPTALERLGGIDADLHITIPSNIQLSNPSLAPSTQTVNGDSSVSYEWAFQGVTAAGRNVDFDLTLQNMTYNEDRAVATSAYLEFANSFSGENLRTNLTIPHVQASRDLNLTESTDQPSYPAQTDVGITSRVTNAGPTVSSALVNLVVRHSDGTVVADLGSLPVGPLAANAAVILPSIWNTGTYLPGGYQVYGRLLSSTGSLISESTTSFAITTASAVVGASIVPDKVTYQAWDSVSLTSRIRNLVPNAIQPSSLAEVTVRTPGGQTLFFSSYGVAELGPSALRDVLSTVSLADAASGIYPVSLVVKDAFTHNVVATAAASFQVSGQAVQGLTGNVKVASTRVYKGDTALCTDTVTNLSESPLPGVTLTRSIVSLDSGTVLSSSTLGVDFTAGQSQVLMRTIATTSLQPGAYACVLSAEVGGTSRQLGQAGFQVTSPPVRVESSMALGTHGRVLVLVDAAPSPYNADDPFGPDCAPDLITQRAHIVSVLRSHGWSYKIVDNATAFQSEFNTNGYEVVVVLSEAVKIPESVQDRMVTAVSKGMGLIVAGNHDNRNGRLGTALGISSLGKNLDASGLIVLSSAVMGAAQETFPVITPPNAIKVDTATVIAQYRLMKPKPHQQPEPAVTLNYYGSGRAIYAGFDLPLEGAADGDDGLFGQLFEKSLEFVHPTVLTPYSQRVLPFTLTLANLGVATSGQVIVTLPTGAQAIDPGTGAIQPNGSIVWPFSMIQNQSLTLPFWVRMPNVVGDATLQSRVQVGTPGNYQDNSTSSLVVRLQVRP